MSRHFRALFLFLFLIAACAPPAPASTYGLDDLTADLRRVGLAVEDGGAVDQEFFSVSGRMLVVAGQSVQVFEYADEAARQAESGLIQPDGAPNPTTMVMWIDQPNFFARGRLIALYVGRDSQPIEGLTAALGQSLTEPWPAQ